MRRSFLTALTIPLLLLAGSAPALAAENDVTWSVRPSDGTAADGRAWVEQELDPGEGAEEHLIVENFSDEAVTFELSAADGVFRDNGRFSMLGPGETSTDAGTWIDVPESVTVEARSTEVVPFTTTVPADATPGDHAAGIAASIRSQGSATDGTGVTVQSRVGFRVMTRVTGTIEPALSVSFVSASYDTSWNPLQPGSATVTFTATNEGNTRLLIAGTGSLAGSETTFPLDSEQELLPGDSRTLTVPVADVWPLVYVSGSITVSPTVTGVSAEALDDHTVQVSVWAWPVPQLIVLVGVALIVLALVAGRIRSRRRLAALLARTREEALAEGRASAER